MVIHVEPAIDHNVARLQELCQRLRDGGKLSPGEAVWLAEYAMPIVLAARNVLPDIQRWSGPTFRKRIALEKALRNEAKE